MAIIQEMESLLWYCCLIYHKGYFLAYFYKVIIVSFAFFFLFFICSTKALSFFFISPCKSSSHSNSILFFFTLFFSFSYPFFLSPLLPSPFPSSACSTHFPEASFVFWHCPNLSWTILIRLRNSFPNISYNRCHGVYLTKWGIPMIAVVLSGLFLYVRYLLKYPKPHPVMDSILWDRHKRRSFDTCSESCFEIRASESGMESFAKLCIERQGMWLYLML